MVEMQGVTAFITGGAQGIGLGIARALARQGAHIALADIDVAELTRAKAELAPLAPTETFELDVRDRDAFADVADRVESALGPVSLLFNNAGIAPGIPVGHMTYEQWDWALGVNLSGVVNGIQTFVPRMIERGQGGYIVNTASGAGLVAVSGFLYTTAKYAVVGLSESLHDELAPYGIGVSVLCPGPVDTGIIDNTRAFERASTSSGLPSEAFDEARAFLRTGISIDAVGELVIAAMAAGDVWIQTDASVRTAVEMRTSALLASFSNL